MASGGRVAVEAFNEYVARSEGAWTRSPVALAATFLALEEQESERAKLRVRWGELARSAVIEVTVEDVGDDSIRAYRYVLEAIYVERDQTWRIHRARWAQRCWPGRGHQAFSTAFCV